MLFNGKLFRRVLTAFFCFCFVVSVAAAGKGKGKAAYPEAFPEELRNLPCMEQESKELAPGVMYYHFHFENVVPEKEPVPEYVVWQVFVDAKSDDAEKRAAGAREKLLAAHGENIGKLAKELSDDVPGGLPASAASRSFSFEPGWKFMPPEIEAAIVKLEKKGDATEVVRSGAGYWIFVLDKINRISEKQKAKKFPMSVYYVIVDWNKAKVKLGLEQCGDSLQTVKKMVKNKKKLLAAINGAYFHFKPPTTFYPLKINGKMYEATGYDSHTGLCFSGSDFPVLDTEENFGKYDNVIMGYHIGRYGNYALDGKKAKWDGILSGDTPLTSVGMNPEKKIFVMMTSDGRFPKDAPGLNFFSEFYMMKAAGCTEVLSIDGGGSCTMLTCVRSKLSDPLNHPSDNKKFDHDGARSVQNCIYLQKSK